MIVFSNTTPIIALSSIQRLDLLPHLFGHIRVVAEVVDECEAGGAIVVPFLRGFDWLTIVESTPISHPSLLLELDKGEKHTLDMAQKQQADWVLIDEKIGRNMAEYLMQQHGIYYHPGLIEKLRVQIGE